MQPSTSYLINGEFLQGVSPIDRGFAYGDGVFRTLKVVKNLPVRWALHYQKLVEDCSAIGIVCPSADILMSDIEILFSDEKDTVAVCKIIITRGEGNRGYALPAVVEPSRIVVKTAMPRYPDIIFQDGVELSVCETRLAHQKQLAGIKHLNRLENVLARAELNDPKFFDGIMLDVDNHVMECTSANLFVRTNRTLVTPTLTQCGVAGITRQSVINFADKLDLSVRVTELTMESLLNADEVVICNSLYGALQVKTVADKTWTVTGLAKKIRIELDS